MEAEQTVDPNFAYLVISPNPCNGNYIWTGGGIPIAEKKDGEDVIGLDDAKIHYVKIGHQRELGKRFANYNTDNPLVWFRHFEIEKPLSPDTKSDNLKDHEIEDNTNKNMTSANYIQKLTLEAKFEKAPRAEEWFLVPGELERLSRLCGALDSDKGKQKKDIKKGKETIKGWVNTFASEDELIDFLKEHGGGILSFNRS